MTFHQVVPHAHHEHQQQKKEISDHHHSDDHHHHNDDKEEKNTYDFLSYLLSIHSHVSGSNEILILKNYSGNFSFKKAKAKKNSARKYTSGICVLTELESKGPEVYHPPRHYFDPYLSFLSLRGPPQLI